MFGWIDRSNQVELVVGSGRIECDFFFSKQIINWFRLKFRISVFHQKQQLKLLSNAWVHCCRIIKFRQFFTAPHLVTHYQVLSVASILSPQLSYYNAESDSIRKQSRLLAKMLEIYVLSNKHTVFQETELLGQKFLPESKAMQSFVLRYVRANLFMKWIFWN